MFSKLSFVSILTLFIILMTKHVSFGDYGCGLFGNTCGYECFRYCVVAGYGSGGCRGTKCICDWNVINETAIAIQTNPNYNQNYPQNTNRYPNSNQNPNNINNPNINPNINRNTNSVPISTNVIPNQVNQNPNTVQNGVPNVNPNVYNPNFPAQPYNPQYGQPYNQGYQVGVNRTQFLPERSS